MRFSALLLLSVISSSLAQAPTTVIRAGVGETVTMECPHTPKRKHIGWCRANSSEKCIIVVDTVKYNDNGRTSIRRLNESVFVTTSQLKKRDSGTYWCGHYKENSIIISDIVMLEVFTADSWTPNKTTVNGMMGNSTTLHCQYEEQFKSYKKFLCKVTSVNRCSIIASSEQSNSRKLSISINNYSNFAVTMKQTDEADEGEYWCGATITVDFEIVQVKILEFYKATRRPKVPTNIGRNNTPQIWHIVLPLVLGLLVLLLIVLLIKRMKRMKPITPENNNKIPETPATTKSMLALREFLIAGNAQQTEKDTEDTITYSTVTIQPSTQAEESPVIYSNLKDMKEQNGDIKIHSSESVEYSTLMFSS